MTAVQLSQILVGRQQPRPRYAIELCFYSRAALALVDQGCSVATAYLLNDREGPLMYGFPVVDLATDSISQGLGTMKPEIKVRVFFCNRDGSVLLF